MQHLFLGMLWKGVLHIDAVLPFGLRSAPKIFNTIADAAQYTTKQKRLSILSTFWTTLSRYIAIASSPAGLVLAGPVFTVIFGTAHAQIMNNKKCFTFMLHAHAHSFKINSSMHGWWNISAGPKGLFKLVFAGQKACYCKFIKDWAWLKSPVCLLWLKVHLDSVLESEFQQKQKYNVLKVCIESEVKQWVLIGYIFNN